MNRSHFAKRWVVPALVLIASATALWIFRPKPWMRAQRALDNGNPGKSVQIASRALEKEGLLPNEEERLREVLAAGYLFKGSLDNAETEWRTLRQKFPNNFNAALGLGAINLALGKSSFAEDYLKEAKKLNPGDSRCYVLLVHLYGGRREYVLAEAQVVEGLSHDAGSRSLLELQGDLYFDRGHYAKALKIYEGLSATYGKDWLLRLKICETHFWSGELDLAKEMLDELRPQERQDAEIDFLLARLLAAQGKREESAALWEKLYLEDNRRLEAGMSWAISLAERDRIDQAEDVLKPIEHQLLPLGGVRTPYGTVSLQELERLDILRRAARRQHVSFRIAKARLAECAGRYNEARDHLDRARSIDGESDAALWAMIDLASLKGDHEDQLKWAERAVGLYQGHPAALLQRARAFLALGKNPDSVFDVRDVADAYPHMAAAQALLARAWLIRGHPDKALAAAEHAVRLNPGDAEAQLALGLSHSAYGFFPEAEDAFRRALDSNPRYAEARAAWAGQLKKQGRNREAAIQMAEAARLEPFNYGKKR